MQKIFTQPSGPVAKDVNKQAIARALGVKKSEVVYLSTDTPVDTYTVAYDPIGQQCWDLKDATGTPISWTVNSLLVYGKDATQLQLITSEGTFVLTELRLIRTFDLLSKLGASYSGLEQGGVIQDALTQLTPYMFNDFTYGSTDDAVPSLQAAINEHLATGRPCHFDGIFYCKTLPVKFQLPGDDGTAYPDWVTAGTDSNITPEDTNYIYSCLDLTNAKITCSPGTKFIWAGDEAFDIATPTIGNNAPVFFTAHSGNAVPTRGLTSYELSGFPTIQGFFAGRIVSGISNKIIDEAQCFECAVSGIWQGGDSINFSDLIEDRNCRAGHITGGWWTQRNRVSSNAAYLPPYPAGDVYDLGWIDSVMRNKYHFYHYLHKWDQYDVALDTWFDTYFFKTANSKTYANGGRATNGGTVDLTSEPFPGIAGRWLLAMSRYKANLADFTVLQLKGLGSFYMPIYVSAKGATQEQLSGALNTNDGHAEFYWRAHIEEAYVERVALLDTSLNSTDTSNRFYENGTSTWASGITEAPSMCGEGNVAVRLLNQSGAVVTTKPNYAPSVTSGPRVMWDIMKNGTSKLLDHIRVWRTDLNGFLKPYKWFSDYCITMPMYFDTSGYGLTTAGKFYYQYVAWTPVIYLAGTAVTASSASGQYHRLGGAVQASGLVSVAASNVTASSLTVSLPVVPGSTAAGGAAYAIGNILQGSISTPVILSVSPGTSRFSVLKMDGTAFTPTAATNLQLIFTINYTASTW